MSVDRRRVILVTLFVLVLTTLTCHEENITEFNYLVLADGKGYYCNEVIVDGPDLTLRDCSHDPSTTIIRDARDWSIRPNPYKK